MPLCFDCHAEVGSYNARHPKGRKFSPSELKSHRDTWYQLLKEGKHLIKADPSQQPSVGQDGSESSRVGKFLRWCNDNKLISLVIIVGLVVIGISQFTDALDKIRVFFKPESPSIQPSQGMVNSPNSMQAGRDININSSGRSEYQGVLTPGNSPDPNSTPWGWDIPTNAVKVFLGSIRSASTAMDANHVVIAVKTNHLVWFRRTRDGLYFSADFFRADGRSVAKIRDNRWEVNPNNYFELTNTRHQLIVGAKDGLALKCSYLNENAVQIEGRFQFPDFPTIVITTNQVFMGERLLKLDMSGINNLVDLQF